jgi:FkbM family methyltransferase
MSRILRRFLVKAIPASVRGPLRRLWPSRTGSALPVSLHLQRHATAGQVSAHVGHLPPIVLTESVLSDLRLHCESGEHAGEMRAFTEACRKPGLLVDVGAHNGFFSLLYAAADPSNRVLAFEPSNDLRSRASHLTAINHLAHQIEISASAVADKSGIVEFFADSSSGFVQAQAYPGNEPSGFHPVTLRATTLDEACAERALVPSLVKVDVEGYELEVLQGAKTVLERHRPTIFLELHLNYLEQRRRSPSEVLNLLEMYGYHFFGEDGRRSTASSIGRSWKSVLRLVARPAM